MNDTIDRRIFFLFFFESVFTTASGVIIGTLRQYWYLGLIVR